MCFLSSLFIFLSDTHITAWQIQNKNDKNIRTSASIVASVVRNYNRLVNS